MDWDQILRTIKAVLGAELAVIAGTTITGASLLAFFTVVALTFWAAGLLQRSFERLLLKKGSQDEGTAGAVSRLLRYVILILGLSAGLHGIGINLSTLFAAGALFAVAIGFAMQNVVANFVSGVILLAERAIKPGDIIEADGQMVRVTGMGIRATVVRTLDDEDLVLPNSNLVQATVKNFTLKDRLYRLRVIVGVAYDSDLKQVRRVLETCARNLDWRSQNKDPVVLLTDFGASSVDYEISVWIDDPWKNRQRRSELREAIWWGFKESSITIAFPQLDVHFDGPVVEGLRNRSAA